MAISDMDMGQIIQDCYDKDTHSLRFTPATTAALDGGDASSVYTSDIFTAIDGGNVNG